MLPLHHAPIFASQMLESNQLPNLVWIGYYQCTNLALVTAAADAGVEPAGAFKPTSFRDWPLTTWGIRVMENGGNVVDLL